MLKSISLSNSEKLIPFSVKGVTIATAAPVNIISFIKFCPLEYFLY
jgi:hypothetical protein